MSRIIISIFCILTTISLKAQSYYVQCEDTCSHIHGIDISHYQGNIFWEAIGNNAKMHYVYLKATEGGDNIDAKYERNIELAHQHGLKVGSYHFYRAKTPQVIQLSNFMAQCRPGEQDLIPMIDVETKSGLPTSEFRDSLKIFLDLVEEAYKQKPLVYTGANFYDHNFYGGFLDDYKVMIAQYTEKEPVLQDKGHHRDHRMRDPVPDRAARFIGKPRPPQCVYDRCDAYLCVCTGGKSGEVY